MLDMLKITSADPAIESISGSPARSRGCKSSTPSDLYAGRQVLVKYTSPLSSQNAGSIVVPSNPCGTSTNSSPCSDMLRSLQKDSSWRLSNEEKENLEREAGLQAGTFVNRAGNEADDVFGSPGKEKQSPDRGTWIRSSIYLRRGN